jgi:hypothetical protein
MKGRLTKIESSHNNLRTSQVEGTYEALPKVGERFKLVSESLDSEIRNQGGSRLIDTSPVQQILSASNEVIEFKTTNSHYLFERLETQEQ